jgi:G protein beta subunit-like protein
MCAQFLVVNDVCIHPNQGELISCDQMGSIKQWDLSENVCMLDLVSAAVRRLALVQ